MPIILQNYWVYEQQAGNQSASREALDQGLWPKFPGARDTAAVRLTGHMTLGTSRGSE